MRQLNVAIDFVDSQDENPTLFTMFRILNSNKPLDSKHSANKVYRGKEGEIIVIKCNCGKNIYHPVTKNKVNWKRDISAIHISILREFGVEKGLELLED